MIISYSNDFVVIRPPKTGSTSLAFYFFDSGLLNFDVDIFALEGDLHSWEKFNAINEEYKETYLATLNKIKWCAKESWVAGNIPSVHRTFEDLRIKSAIQKDMPCVATIRNPLERASSIFNYVRLLRMQAKEFLGEELSNPNNFWDSIKEEPDKFFASPQCSYFPDHAELFNTENLHEHVSKYILERGGKVNGRIEMRKNPDNKLDVFLAELTPDRKQDILDTYAKDFELWEKAYAVYN